jgi:type II secretory pathway component PulJ
VKNNHRPLRRVNAFSVLEVTIVIALMALLGALFFGALNRFNEQIAHETAIKNELNDWFVVRANLWRELDDADSILVKDNRAEIYLAGNTTEYTISDNRLYRKTPSAEIADMKIAMNAIVAEELKGRQYVSFRMDWKNEEMVLRFPLRSTLAATINHYFQQRQWQ